MQANMQYHYEGFRRRALGKMWQKHGINEFELMMLCCLASHVARVGRSLISKRELFDGITGNSLRKAKMEGYLKGLITKQFVGSYEYITRPDSLSVGVSDLGHKVLIDFNTEINRLMGSVEQLECQQYFLQPGGSRDHRYTARVA
jgi:hypothetical protein